MGVDFVLGAVLVLIVFILSLTVHEYAHARVAYWLGDDTAARMGRLTLNPIPHIDPIGTLIMPIIGMATGIPVIGWAKPVPVSLNQLTRRFTMHTGHALVAVAGPLSNILLAVISIALIKFVILEGLIAQSNLQHAIFELLRRMFFANLGLAVFNLLPVPPLDGSRLLPRSLDGLVQILERYSFIAFICIIWFGRDIIIQPVIFLIKLLAMIFNVPPNFLI